MRCVSSFFFTALPSPFDAAITSARGFSGIDFSLRSREYEINQRIANAVRRSGRTSTGTWYVAPPTRRLFTSRRGFTLSNALRKISKGSSLKRALITSKAPYRMPSAVDFFPPIISELVNLATSLSLYLGSGVILRFGTSLRRGIAISSYLRLLLGALDAVLGATAVAGRLVGAAGACGARC